MVIFRRVAESTFLHENLLNLSSASNYFALRYNNFPFPVHYSDERTKRRSRESRLENWSAQGGRERSMSRILIRPARSNACQINDPVAITTGPLLTAVESPFLKGDRD